MFIKLATALLATNLAFAAFLFPWVTDDDFTGLRENGPERFADLFYFSVASFSTAGTGDISPKTTRARTAVTLFLLFVIVSAIDRIYNGFAKSR